jgi:putative Mg2+ transporter-C (MgtC) family protein
MPCSDGTRPVGDAFVPESRPPLAAGEKDGTSMEQMLREEFLETLALPLPVIFARMFGAVVLCGIIGYEREATDHEAGLKTHMILGLAATMFALVTIHIVDTFGGPDYEAQKDVIRLDPIRLVEAATAGVAFLAAGMIFMSKGEVKNLTTGAVMWLTASVGLALGFGLWAVAILATVLEMLILVVVRRLAQ